MPALPIQRPPLWPILGGRRHHERTRPLDVCPFGWPGNWQWCRRKMDRRFNRRAWRFARHHRPASRPRSFPRYRRRGMAISRNATRSRAPSAAGSFRFAPAPGRIAGIGAPPVRHVKADCGYNRGDVSARTRHYGFARSRKPPLPSKLLLSSASRSARRNLAGHDRRRHRSRWHDHRGSSHLARPA